MARLARVVDVDPDASTGEADITVPRAWLDARDTVEVTLPLRLRCHHCAGGGCDRCERSGVFRLPEEITARRFDLPLPDRACRLRLPDPVGSGSPALVLLRVHEGEPSDNVRREQKRGAGRARRIAAAIAVALAAALAYFAVR